MQCLWYVATACKGNICEAVCQGSCQLVKRASFKTKSWPLKVGPATRTAVQNFATFVVIAPAHCHASRLMLGTASCASRGFAAACTPSLRTTPDPRPTCRNDRLLLSLAQALTPLSDPH